MRKYQELLAQKMIEIKNTIIEHVRPDVTSSSQINMIQDGSTKEEKYYYNNSNGHNDFIKFWPISVKWQVDNDGVVTLSATLKYKRLDAKNE